MKLLKDELLTQPFQLAYFIHDDKEIAKRITTAALERLETATQKQDKRLYYFSIGRRNRISFTSLHLLQRLVYDESENYEKQREHDPACPLSEERLLVHFIKHLVKITVRRRSLYVALGLSRILHRYTTAETTEIYNVVIQDPARVSDEDYCRRTHNLSFTTGIVAAAITRPEIDHLNCAPRRMQAADYGVLLAKGQKSTVSIIFR